MPSTEQLLQLLVTFSRPQYQLTARTGDCNRWQLVTQVVAACCRLVVHVSADGQTSLADRGDWPLPIRRPSMPVLVRRGRHPRLRRGGSARCRRAGRHLLNSRQWLVVKAYTDQCWTGQGGPSTQPVCLAVDAVRERWLPANICQAGPRISGTAAAAAAVTGWLSRTGSSTRSAQQQLSQVLVPMVPIIESTQLLIHSVTDVHCKHHLSANTFFQECSATAKHFDNRFSSEQLTCRCRFRQSGREPVPSADSPATLHPAAAAAASFDVLSG